MKLRFASKVQAVILEAAQNAASTLFDDSRLEIRVNLAKGLGQPTVANLEVRIVDPKGHTLMDIPLRSLSSLHDGDTLTITGLNMRPDCQVSIE